MTNFNYVLFTNRFLDWDSLFQYETLFSEHSLLCGTYKMFTKKHVLSCNDRNTLFVYINASTYNRFNMDVVFAFVCACYSTVYKI